MGLRTTFPGGSMTHSIRIATALTCASLALLASLARADAPAAPDFVHAAWLDTSVDPLKDFYGYANGGFLKSNQIPPAYPMWGHSMILNEDNNAFVRQVLESAAADRTAPAGSELRKLGDFFASGMDEAAINKAGITPLKGELARIAALRTASQLPSLLAHLQVIGVNAAFGVGEMQDFADSTQVIAAIDQGGLGLPDRDYYLKDDARFAAIREFYVGHVARMLEKAGVPAASSKARATAVFELEKKLAQASMPTEKRRDPHAIYHMTDVTALGAIAPGFDWPAYLRDSGVPPVKRINVQAPEFFAELSKQYAQTPIGVWRDYLAWHLVHGFAAYLSQDFVDENFHYAQQIVGTKELRPRWRRVLGTEQGVLGFAIGHEYVKQRFPPEAKAQVLEILHGVRAALKDDLETLQWMTPATRAKALEKLALIEERIGYPDKWRDYSALRVDRGPYVLNVIHANEFENARQLAKIGKPVDRAEWDMLPQDVNAYYDPSMNNINFPAGILQPPFFDANRPAAFNYGAIGAVIGHEITHGFDDEGSQFDGHGNLADWWAPEDKEHFKAGVKCIADLFSSFTVDEGLHLKGELVSGESIADLGGILLAQRAFRASPGYASAQPVGGFTPDQQFFLGYGWFWADLMRPEFQRMLATSDPHPPSNFRTIGTLMNVPDFAKAFGPAGTPASQPRCVVW
ncbi:MAG: metallopeptidase PepO, peptidase family [Pseudomonadota bacterium]